LIPGRRTVVVMAEGEGEVKGDALTPDRISKLVEPTMSAEARRALATGWAEWDFALGDKGTVRGTAELRLGLMHATLSLERCNSRLERQKAPVAAEPPPTRIDPREAARAAREADREATHGEADDEARSVRTPLKTVPPAPMAMTIPEAGLSSGSSAEMDQLLVALVELRGSDLHISTGAPPMMRIDGELKPMPGRAVLSAEDMQRIVWPIIPRRNREEFSKLHDTDFSYELSGRSRFRGNLFVDMRGMGAVFRVIPTKIVAASELGIPKEVLELCKLPKGLVLVTGPTGSGKSTTLAAMMDWINDNRHDHVITIEDPIEFVHKNKKCLINQRQVNEHTLSFKSALRAALREDPDVVLLGEMRDLETISIAIETAETGHLVFGTLHTSSAPATVDRIIDQFPAGQQNQIRVMLADALKGVISQTLCKKVGGGRVAALEILFGTPAVANLIREGKIFQIPSIMQTGRKSGMRLLNDSLLDLVKRRVVAPEEALNKALDKSGLLGAYRENNIQVSA
jgi:twitching motility protein PilT